MHRFQVQACVCILFYGTFLFFCVLYEHKIFNASDVCKNYNMDANKIWRAIQWPLKSLLYLHFIELIELRTYWMIKHGLYKFVYLN